MSYRIISTGRAGVDQSALNAARACDLLTGGYVPKGYAEIYPGFDVYEVDSLSPYVPNFKNIANAGIVILIGNLRGVVKAAAEYAIKSGKSATHIREMNEDSVKKMIERMEWSSRRADILWVNVSGNEEHECPGISEESELFLREVFLKVRYAPK